MNQLPNTLPTPWGEIRRAGAGNSASGNLYTSLSGRKTAVFEGRLVSISRFSALAQIVGLAKVGLVKIDLPVLVHSRSKAPGDRLLLGDIRWLPKASAALAWPYPEAASQRIRTQIHRGGRCYVRAGTGKPGRAVVFIDPAVGKTIETFLARVIRAGDQYDLVQVTDQPLLGPVRIEKNCHPLVAGDEVLVAEIAKLTRGPRAAAWWTAQER
jgi:hypothetical protein